MEYRVICGTDAYTMGLVPTGMAEENLVGVGASGSAAGTIMYFANYFRIDGNEIDQEPYIELYESGSNQPTLYGILHHANFSGRTETLGNNELAQIAASGSDANIQFIAKPDNDSGTLEELRAQGKILGFDYAYIQGKKEKKK